MKGAIKNRSVLLGLLSMLVAVFFTFTILSASVSRSGAVSGYELTEVQDLDESSPDQGFAVASLVPFLQDSLLISLAATFMVIAAWLVEQFLIPYAGTRRYLLYHNLRIAH
ncbi:MAG: hypothetical protein JNL57_13850 [Bacteroidetes bacterium]|nr:hypothetical protein [Bacteroidota bacterium]